MPSGGAFASIDVALTPVIAQPTKRCDWLQAYQPHSQANC